MNMKSTNNSSTTTSFGVKLLIEKLSTITVEQLDELARTGNTTIATGAFAPDFVAPAAKGNWKYQMVMASKTGDKKMLVLLPGDHRTRGIWRKGQELLATQAGLSKDHAYVWAGSSVPRRHETLSMLASVMKDERLQKAYSAFATEDAVNKGGIDVKGWAKTWGVRDAISYKTRVSLGLMVKELLAHDEAKAIKAATGGQVAVNPLLAGFLETAPTVPATENLPNIQQVQEKAEELMFETVEEAADEIGETVAEEVAPAEEPSHGEEPAVEQDAPSLEAQLGVGQLSDDGDMPSIASLSVVAGAGE